MKKVFKSALLMSAIGIIALATSCTKEETTPTPTPAVTKTTLLAGTSSKSWKFDKFFIAGVDQTIDTCDLDDFMSFYTTGVFIGDEGLIKCDSTSAQIETGTWNFTDSETKLNLMTGSDTVPDIATILGLTATNLNITISLDTNGTMGEFRYIPKN
jgi:hypothetical protein